MARVDRCTALHQTMAVVAVIGAASYLNLDQADLEQDTAHHSQ
jgi:hypothetical protein